MRCRLLPFLVTFLPLLAATVPAHADDFDYYTNPVLTRAAGSKNVKEVKELTPALMVDHDNVLPGVRAAFVIVKTNEGRLAKLLVQGARQKVDATRTVPMLLIERFVTYKDREERTVVASGKRVALFAGFRFSLDLGQVVPEELGGDLRFVADGAKVYAQPVGKAKLYLLTRALADVRPKKGPKVVVGPTFEPRYFNGTYKLHDDGRRTGTLTLAVAGDGSVTGSYYSDKDGRKYPVKGKIGTPTHCIQFTIQLPRAEQTFQGCLFTGNAGAIAGTSRLLDREAGFYATRVEEAK